MDRRFPTLSPVKHFARTPDRDPVNGEREECYVFFPFKGKEAVINPIQSKSNIVGCLLLVSVGLMLNIHVLYRIVLSNGDTKV